jgi:CheY-like chemotaxis protein
MPANKTILLVEDDMITAAVESAMLKKNGFDVIIAPSGENAVEIVRYRAVDLILMDIDLGHGLS